MRIILFLLFLNAFNFNYLKAESDFVITNYNSKNSSISDVILSTIQDSHGYLWIGTEKGLYKFNGKEFKKKYINELKGVAVTDLVYSGNRLLIATYDGLFVVTYGLNDQYTMDHFLENSVVTKLIKNSNDMAWLLTDNGLRKVICKDTELKIDEKIWLKDSKPISMYIDKNDNVFVGTNKNGLFLFSEGDFVKFNSNFDDFSITEIFKDKDGIFWVGTNDNGLFSIDKDMTKHFTVDDGLLSNKICVLGENQFGDMLIGTLKGLQYYKNNKVKNHEDFNPFNDEFITTILSDSEKNIWIGTTEEGLFKIRKRIFKKINVNEPLSLCCISAFVENKNNTKFVSRYPGFIASIEEKGKVEVLQDLNEVGGHVKYFEVDSFNSIYCGTSNRGIYKIENKTIEKIDVNKILKKDITITSMGKSNEDRIYLGTLKSGLYYLDDDKPYGFEMNELIGECQINAIEFDSENNIYLGTSKGLITFKNNKMIVLLDKVFVVSLYIDKENIKWVCTDGDGFCMLTGDNYEINKFTYENGLRTNNFYQVLEDNNGNIWLTSDIGILKINKETLKINYKSEKKIIKTLYLGFDDGLDSLDFINNYSKNSIMKSESNELWFATRHGIFSTNPLSDQINNMPVIRTFVNRIKVNGNDVLVSNHLQIKKNDNVNFVLDAPTFVSTENLQFYCILKGESFNKKIIIKDSNELKFSNLKTGNYTLSISALNRNGELNKNSTTMSLKVTYSFFDLKLFIILFLFVAILLLIFIIYFNPFSSSLGKNKPAEKDLNIENLNEIVKEIKYLLEVEKIYKEENMNLDLFSEKLGIPSYLTSQVINRKFQLSFSELMNKYRIIESKERLLNPKEKDTKVIDIAFDAGFNSKAMFNIEFKKATGKTPSQFRKENLK